MRFTIFSKKPFSLVELFLATTPTSHGYRSLRTQHFSLKPSTFSVHHLFFFFDRKGRVLFANILSPQSACVTLVFVLVLAPRFRGDAHFAFVFFPSFALLQNYMLRRICFAICRSCFSWFAVKYFFIPWANSSVASLHQFSLLI